MNILVSFVARNTIILDDSPVEQEIVIMEIPSQ